MSEKFAGIVLWNVAFPSQVPTGAPWSSNPKAGRSRLSDTNPPAAHTEEQKIRYQTGKKLYSYISIYIYIIYIYVHTPGGRFRNSRHPNSRLFFTPTFQLPTVLSQGTVPVPPHCLHWVGPKKTEKKKQQGDVFGRFVTVTMQIPGSSKSLSDWSFLQCSHVKNFPNFSHRFFGKVGLFPSEPKKLPGRKFRKISNFQWLQPNSWGLKNIHGEFLVGPDLQRKKKHKTPQKDVALTQLEVFQFFWLAALVGW